MRVNSTVLGLVLAAFAAPALAGGSGNDVLMSGFVNDTIERPDALPAALTAAPPADTQQRTFEITFTAQVGTVTPLDPAARLATPSADASQAQGGGMGAGKANFGGFNPAIPPGSAPTGSGHVLTAPSHPAREATAIPRSQFENAWPAKATAAPPRAGNDAVWVDLSAPPRSAQAEQRSIQRVVGAESARPGIRTQPLRSAGVTARH